MRNYVPSVGHAGGITYWRLHPWVDHAERWMRPQTTHWCRGRRHPHRRV